MGKISRRTFLFGVGGGVVGLFQAQPDDSTEQIAGKVAFGTAAGMAVGKVTGGLNRVHDAATRPTEDDIRETESFRERSYRKIILKDGSEKRSGSRENDDERDR